MLVINPSNIADPENIIIVNAKNLFLFLGEFCIVFILLTEHLINAAK